MNDTKAQAAYHPQQPPGEQVSTYGPVCPHCDRDTGLPRGMSAQAIFAVLHGHKGNAFPWDPSDFGRCYQYLESIGKTTPTWMREVSPIWRDFVDNWEELRGLYEDQLSRGKPNGMYERMREIMEPHKNRRTTTIKESQ